MWRPRELEMVNHETGKKTKLIWEEYEFKTGLTESDFSTSSLERVR
ncbi:outer membrane lipoprotein-sorting protein [Parvibaculum sp.]|nr:outer membrane lipoprotein-sorting protein [Parvibaculum sp.]